MTLSLTHTYLKTQEQCNPRDLWPLRHFITVMRTWCPDQWSVTIKRQRQRHQENLIIRMSIHHHHHMYQYSNNSIIMIVTLTMHVLVILLEMCVCYMVTYIQLSMTSAGAIYTCRCHIHLQVSYTPARRCYIHLHAGVTVTNLYTLVKHASRVAYGYKRVIYGHFGQFLAIKWVKMTGSKVAPIGSRSNSTPLSIFNHWFSQNSNFA